MVTNRLPGRRVSVFLLLTRGKPYALHVSHPDGEAKFWLEPTIELARNIGLNSSKMKEAERLVESRKKEITDAWNNHFGC
ncbi:DUF4160 domain-containing protein [Synechococcus sp. BA-132 BA5]|uniref:DUF4160 domain-containing protein n=1 Tax=Synechococcus sp. BA-132 BA5 TaxID=3110252 RepID=UPI003FCE8140